MMKTTPLPRLHQAIVDDDRLATSELACNTECCREKNYLGLSALELAMLLARDECVGILRQALALPEVARAIKIRSRKTGVLSSCSTAEFESCFGARYIENPIFSSFEALQEAIGDVPWLLTNTFVGLEQRRLGAWLHAKLVSGYIGDVYIDWVNDTVGWGLFADKALDEGTFIGQYCGAVRKMQKGAKDAINEYCLRYPSRFFSFHYWVLDARNAANETRCINHSFTPNLKAIALIDRQLLHVGFFTTRPCNRGEELCFNYGTVRK